MTEQVDAAAYRAEVTRLHARIAALWAENERLRLRVETADAYIDGKLWDSNVADCAAELEVMTVERNALRAENERLRQRLAVEEEAERELGEHNDRLQEELDRLRDRETVAEVLGNLEDCEHVGQEPGSEGTPASMQREGTNPICRYPLHTGSHGSECFTRPAGAEGRAT